MGEKLINDGLDGQKETELETLQEKVRDETISSRERAQLLRLTDAIEEIAARRAQALIELAAIRKTTVQKLIRDLELTENAYA